MLPVFLPVSKLICETCTHDMGQHFVAAVLDGKANWDPLCSGNRTVIFHAAASER